MSIPEIYHAAKEWIAVNTGYTDPILHTHGGLLILVATWAITRRPLGSFIPFAAVVSLEVLNEVLDFIGYGWRAADTYSDIGHTIFWPLVISVCARFLPARPHGSRASAKRYDR
ncbi:hypothetical protein [Sphingomonas sp. GM_Shp_2]|uniref:hypothetical protein n=1 Tax=Sphingomonas sp. GM_Shp_2 TaxID=2937380 RepID=UPI00226AC174|nr:hypothetical protein [Sphingomonas sp. GM_Shp_2]